MKGNLPAHAAAKAEAAAPQFWLAAFCKGLRSGCRKGAAPCVAARCSQNMNGALKVIYRGEAMLLHVHAKMNSCAGAACMCL